MADIIIDRSPSFTFPKTRNIGQTIFAKIGQEVGLPLAARGGDLVDATSHLGSSSDLGYLHVQLQPRGDGQRGLLDFFLQQ